MDIFSIIGPVMIGPSSSHTAGACKIGNIAAVILGEKPVSADITLYGSFSKTGKGHGSDRAIVAGVLGFHSDDLRLRDAFRYADEEGLKLRFDYDEKAGVHPNTVSVKLTGESGGEMSIVGSSIGGGRVVIDSVNGFNTDFDGMHHTTIVIHRDVPGVIAAVTGILADDDVNIAKMSLNRSKRGGTAALIIEADHAPSAESIEGMGRISAVSEIFKIPRMAKF